MGEKKTASTWPPLQVAKSSCKVQPVQGRDAKRWNFRKANWAGFTALVNKAAAGLPPPCHNDLNDAYNSYCKMLQAAAKKTIPRGIRKAYVPLLGC